MYVFVFILLTLFAGNVSAFAINPISLYGDKIEFDVIRDGEVVGEHITRFKQNERALYVTSDMNIDIFVLFIPVYAFDYSTTEKWVSDKMVALDVKVIDGPDRLDFTASHKEGGMFVQMDDQEVAIAPDVLTTNHWNPNVINDKQVLNTLTGNLNNVTITPVGWEKVSILDGSVKAKRYDYSGDLTDTSAWYDDQGRWVKLRFLARDGSTIEYRCRTCKSGSSK